MLKIALIGYGKMGKAIESLSTSQNVQIVTRIDPGAPEADFAEVSAEALQDADICLEFTHPDSILGHLKVILDLGKPVVVGTTGWQSRQSEVRGWVEQRETALLYGENFSIGVHLFRSVVQHAARLLDPFSEYDLALSECHHSQKADSPSGTAISLAETVLAEVQRKTEWTSFPSGDSRQLQVGSLRCGSIPGSHHLHIEGPADSITLSHQARGREGFALGALQAAKWLAGRQGFFHFSDIFQKEGDPS